MLTKTGRVSVNSQAGGIWGSPQLLSFL